MRGDRPANHTDAPNHAAGLGARDAPPAGAKARAGDAAAWIVVAAAGIAALVLALAPLARRGFGSSGPAATADAAASPDAAADAAAPAAPRPSGVGDATGDAFQDLVPKRFALPAAGIVAIGDADFAAAYDAIYDGRDAAYGREVELEGYVLRQEGLVEGSYLIGRDLIWCCEDDAYFIGYLVLDDGPVPEEGTPLRVRGVFRKAAYASAEGGMDILVPAIRVEARSPAPDLKRRVRP